MVDKNIPIAASNEQKYEEEIQKKPAVPNRKKLRRSRKCFFQNRKNPEKGKISGTG